MALTAFYIKQGDRLPSLSATLEEIDGSAVDLSGGTVKFLMRRRAGLAALIDASAAVVNASLGQVRYDWGAGETATPGTYQGEFEFTNGDGKKLTFPNTGYISVVITDDVG